MSGTYIRIWEENGEVAIDPSYADPIRLAYEAWVERAVDSVVTVRTLSGDTYSTRASNLDSFLVSTPQGRRRTLEIERAQADERREIRAELGLSWEDE